jgi:hypothetical protein
MAPVMAARPAVSQIVGAAYGEPTDRYPHRVLGDRSEMAALRITLADGTVHVLRWPPGMVFEDTEPRLADLDGEQIVRRLHIAEGLSYRSRLDRNPNQG